MTKIFWIFNEFEFKEVKEWEQVEIQIMRKWKRNHPMYWEVKVDDSTLDDVVKNFEENKRWVDLAIDENHESNHKALWRIRKVYKKGTDALFATIELTKMGAELVSKWAYKYFSPEIIFNSKDPETGEKIKNLLVGWAFTNRPFFKAMQPLMASEIVDWQADLSDNILYFNNESMNKLMELLAKFTDWTMTEDDRVELLTKFNDMSDEDKTDEMKAAVEEATKVKEEEKKEEEKKEEFSDKKEDDEDKEEDKKEEFKAEEVTMKASEFAEMQALANQAKDLINERRKSSIESRANGFKFSDDNKVGIVLPKIVSELVEFAETLSDAKVNKFFSIIEKLQTLSANEIWHSEDNNESVNREKVEFIKEKFNYSEEEAIAVAKAS